MHIRLVFQKRRDKWLNAWLRLWRSKLYLFNDALLTTYFYSVEWHDYQWWTGKEVEKSGRDVFQCIIMCLEELNKGKCKVSMLN